MDLKKELEEMGKETHEELVYSQLEKDYKAFLLKRFTLAKDERDKKHAEFDDMDYFTYYDTNRRAANAYIPPKKNLQDTRIVTGTTKEKEHTMLSALLNYKLEPDIQAFDDNNVEIKGVGEDMQALVKKSKEMEGDDDKKVLRYKELMDQGTVFVEEVWREKFFLDKKFSVKDFSTMNPNKIQWESKLKKLYERAESRVIEGVKVYLGNIREFFIGNQPYLFTAEYMHYDDAKTIFGNWERWKYVPRKLKSEKEEEHQDGSGTYDYDWAIQRPEEDWVEVLIYQDKPRNEYMIMLNGVMMMPISFPLQAISPSAEYTLAKGDVSPMAFNFAYSKSIPADTKVDQGVLDEMLRMIILKTQQSFMPPIANRSNKILSSKIFLPGTIINDIDSSKVQPLLSNQSQGVTGSEFQAYQFIKGIVDNKTVSPAFSGQSESGDQTATEVIQLKKQQMMKLGLTIWGVISLERQLSWLRCYNLKENLPKVKGNKKDGDGKAIDVFPSFTINNIPLSSGQQGTKIIEFNPEKVNSITDAELAKEEKYLSEPGRPVEKVYYHPEEFRNLKAHFYITVNPKEKESDEINRALFVQNIQDAANIFGMESLNLEYLKQRFAEHAKEDFGLFFKKTVQTQASETPIAKQQEQGQANPNETLQRQQKIGGELGKQLTEGIRGSANSSKQKL